MNACMYEISCVLNCLTFSKQMTLFFLKVEYIQLKALVNDDAGVAAFKEVARKSTHTILGACSRPEQQSSDTISSSRVCSHSSDIQQRHKSTLMPNCCRSCFHVFVKNVVHSIMMQKVGCAGSS